MPDTRTPKPPATWRVVDLTTSPERLVRCHTPSSEVAATALVDLRAHPTARYRMSRDTLPPGAACPSPCCALPPLDDVDREIIRRGLGPAFGLPDAAPGVTPDVCPTCDAAPGRDRGNGCASLCDACFDEWCADGEPEGEWLPRKLRGAT
jgi:hypothetical protein